jgi:putative ABC transport system permease protein
MKTSRIIKSGFLTMGRHKMRTFFMMIGIVVGITALTLIFSLGKGAEEKIMERVQKFGLSSLMIWSGGGREIGPSSGGPVTTLTMKDVAALQQEVTNIDVMAPMQRIRDSEIKYQEKNVYVMIIGTSPDWEPVWNWSVTSGVFFDDSDMNSMARVALLGPTVLQELFGEADPIGEQIRIGNVPFQVKGILASKGTSPGGGDMDNRILIPITTAMRRLMNVDYIVSIKVLLKDHSQMKQTVEQISSILRERHHLAAQEPDDFRVIEPTQVKAMASKIIGTFNLFLALIAGLSLIVGGIVVANLMLISVNERTSEIGLRKAVGARSKDILLQFLMETTSITFIGGILGIVLGLSGAQILALTINLPVAVSWEVLVLGIVFSSIVGIAAGVFPARRAAILEPVETLR